MESSRKYLRELRFEDISQVLWFAIKTEHIEKDITAQSHYFPAWAEKVAWDENIKENEDALNRYELRAPLYKEFSKIKEISYGRCNDGVLTVKTLISDNEKDIIEEFYSDVEKFVAGGVRFLGGYSVVDFNIPFVSFRAMVNNIPEIPSMDVAGLKSWNVKHVICLNELLKGTSRTNISLLGAATAFNLPPYDQENISEVLLTTVNLFNNYLREPLVELKKIEKIEIKQVPLLERIYKSPQIKETEKEELKALLKKKKILKKDKSVIKELLTRLYINCEMFKSDKPEVAERKEKEIQEIIDNI